VYERHATDHHTATLKIRDLPLSSQKVSTPPSHGQLMVRRLLDIFIASSSLVLLGPLLVLISLLIRSESPGPVLLRTPRVGRDGKVFLLVKFRTMRLEAHTRDIEYYQRFEASYFNLSSDPSVTRAGKFLRRFSFDELPTLFNVLRGDMSLVGPRPILPEELRRLQPHLVKLLVSLKPGLYGLGTRLYWRLGASEDWESLTIAEVQFHEHLSNWDSIKLLGRAALDSFRGASAV
jgi:lipopolysaccharide/colanic/teichoic acid biosynthesis glycosyltransferase